MGRGGDGGFMTPKAISNRIKAKGLQKLRWYCQMCEKSCRDENGFKCHCMSEAHLRQMALFRERPQQMMSDFSRTFERRFVSILRIRGRSRILANSIYQEYIAERHHIHMKATQWESLSSFIQYLGRTGQAEVDETPRGWFVKYIDRDPEAVAKQKAEERNQKIALDDVQLKDRMIAKQIEQAGLLEAELGTLTSPTELVRTDSDSKIGFGLSSSESTPTQKLAPDIFAEKQSFSGTSSTKADRHKRSAVETLMESIKAKQPRLEVWVTQGLIVKVLNKRLKDGEFFRKKGEVLEVLDGSFARVKMLDDPQPIIRIDQSELETVIPAIGGKIAVVLGDHQRGRVGTLVSLEQDDFSATVRFNQTAISGFPYSNICKIT